MFNWVDDSIRHLIQTNRKSPEYLYCKPGTMWISGKVGIKTITPLRLHALVAR